MKVLLTILAVVLMAPVLPLVGIALGPAALVILFIVGIALIMAGPGRSGWLRERGRITRARAFRRGTHRRQPPEGATNRSAARLRVSWVLFSRDGRTRLPVDQPDTLCGLDPSELVLREAGGARSASARARD
jgi:hypothetical protein